MLPKRLRRPSSKAIGRNSLVGVRTIKVGSLGTNFIAHIYLEVYWPRSTLKAIEMIDTCGPTPLHEIRARQFFLPLVTFPMIEDPKFLS
jgi:hypothetical protein